MDKVTMMNLYKPIARTTRYKESVVKEIMKEVVPQMIYELEQWKRINLPWLISISIWKSSYTEVYHVKKKKKIPVKNKLAVKITVSQSMRERINYWK